ncbi:hypothetical protein COBRASIX_28 [Enterobacter phage vB_EclS_CobraSix]|uniref:Uncharacterized protein n=1 Tax=Enterobacter phage vB_EclS_CobraSix TaxID=2894794 RepID=A0AAE9CAT9_9CAUD|nr:hypothetical protein PQD12_gp28 [Enterobacter phage vB_EclS_CobraSix]UGO47195.1 hypothetical protein COBRASIX_28 [Enterobacter phage vB_EclS_CobraSix]
MIFLKEKKMEWLLIMAVVLFVFALPGTDI